MSNCRETSEGLKKLKDVPVIGCADGGRFHDGPNPSRGLAMYRVGNKAAGYLIDGQEWRQFPEVIKEGRA